LRTIEVERAWGERRRYAVEEIRYSLAKLYRGFVLWSSLYGEVEDSEERERRELVEELLAGFSRSYLPRSMWLEEGTREKIEDFTEKSWELRSRFAAEVQERGYEEARAGMSRRVSKRLRPLRTQVDSALEAELAGPRPSKWRTRLKGS
jgi:hypothetical protein